MPRPPLLDDAALATAQQVAETHFRPSRSRNDADEPQYCNGRVVTNDAVPTNPPAKAGTQPAAPAPAGAAPASTEKTK